VKNPLTKTVKLTKIKRLSMKKAMIFMIDEAILIGIR